MLVDESLIEGLLRNARIRAAFPCVANIKPSRHGCSACKRNRQPTLDAPAYERAKQCFIHTTAAQKKLLSEILGAKQARFVVRQGRTAVRITVALVSATG
jgi:hypothetical protein